jgi:hypothetical protein
VALAAALAGLGAIRLLGRPQRFGLLVLPTAVALAAAEVGLFPFSARLLLFLLPFYYWVIAIGLDGLLQARSRIVRGAALVAVLGLLIQTGLDARTEFLRPPRWEEPRAVLASLAERARPGDVLYVHPNATHAFAFYHRIYPLPQVAVTPAVLSDQLTSRQQLRDLPLANRVWVLHLDLGSADRPFEPLTRQQVLDTLAERREQLDRIAAPGVTAVLFSPACDSGDERPAQQAQTLPPPPAAEAHPH